MFQGNRIFHSITKPLESPKGPEKSWLNNSFCNSALLIYTRKKPWVFLEFKIFI